MGMARIETYGKCLGLIGRKLHSSSPTRALSAYPLHPTLSNSFSSSSPPRLISRDLSPQIIHPNKWSIGVNQKASRFCTKAGSGGVGVPTSVPATVAHELLQSGYRFLDVRTAEEFSAGHAVGAVNIPYLFRVGLGMAKNPKFLEEVASHFEKTDEILVGCQIGKRSMMAATELLADGYTGVVDVAGGHIAWTQNRLPTES